MLRECGVEAVSVQHEYGIWGPHDGEGVLDFLSALAMPAVATLHTVLRHPTIGQERVMRGILDAAAGVVVMSKAPPRSWSTATGDPGREDHPAWRPGPAVRRTR
jgi:hypothetical protein